MYSLHYILFEKWLVETYNYFTRNRFLKFSNVHKEIFSSFGEVDFELCLKIHSRPELQFRNENKFDNKSSKVRET